MRIQMTHNIVYKKYLFVFIASLSGLLITVAAVNIYFDPLMCFRTVSASNRLTPIIDNRLQKTNRLLHSGETFDALLIGSSRVEQFRQQDFAPLKVFNYSMASFYPDEAEDYIKLFLRVNKRKPSIIFLGLDFYGSNLHAYEHAKPPSYYIDTCSPYLYPFKSALSRDMLKYSFRMARGQHQTFRYDRVTLDKITNVLSPQESSERRKKQLGIYASTHYGDYIYNNNYAAMLQRLKAGNPELQFVVFTTPVSKELLSLLVKTGRFADYERWLKDIVDSFGSVYNFMIIDQLTSETGNFLDAHHLYPERTAPLARIITDRPIRQDQEVGQLITRENLAAHLVAIRRIMTTY